MGYIIIDFIIAIISIDMAWYCIDRFQESQFNKNKKKPSLAVSVLWLITAVLSVAKLSADILYTFI